MRFALAQMSPVSGDVYGNTARILSYIEQARSSGADVVVFPEMAITGYCVSDMVENRDFLQENRRMLNDIAAAPGSMAIVAGFVDYDEGERNEDGGEKH